MPTTRISWNKGERRALPSRSGEDMQGSPAKLILLGRVRKNETGTLGGEIIREPRNEWEDEKSYFPIVGRDAQTGNPF